MNKLLIGCLLALPYSAMASLEKVNAPVGVTIEEAASKTQIDPINVPVKEAVSKVHVEGDVAVAPADKEAESIDVPDVEAVLNPQEESAVAPVAKVDAKAQTKNVVSLDGGLVLRPKAESVIPVVEAKPQVEKISAPLEVASPKVQAETVVAPVVDMVTNTQAAVVVSPVETIATPSIDPLVIRKLLHEHFPKFKFCYQHELDKAKNQNTLKGAVNIKFIIESEGKVNRSEITSKEITSDKLVNCMKGVIEGIQFPAPRGGKTVEVNQPMNLYPKRI